MMSRFSSAQELSSFAPQHPSEGIHISRGVRLRIPVGGLKIRTGTDGNDPSMEVSSVELQLDTCVHWLEIALEHLARMFHKFEKTTLIVA